MRTTTLTMIDGVRVVVPDSLDQISLERCALSDHIGTADLSLHQHSELNSPFNGELNSVSHETVLVRLRT